MKRFKSKKAQQLVEFLLLAPFLVIILGVLTEYAYALNINMTLTEGLKTSTAAIYAKISPGMSANDVKSLVKTNLTDYLNDNNAPTLAENNLNVSYFNVGQSVIFTAQYTYYPAFTLPNVFFHILPDKFNFFVTSAVPVAFLNPNNYDASLTSTNLDKIWSSTADFSSLDSFSDSEKGIMKDTTGRANMLFLIPVSANLYGLVDWSGTVLGSYLFVNTSDGKLYNCALDGTSCSGGSTSLMTYLQSNNLHNVTFIHDSTIYSLDDLASQWISSSATDLTPTSIQGVLKRTLALIDTTNMSIGNYDNIDVSAYNPDIASVGSYTMQPYGSMVFIKTSADDISKIATGSMPNYSWSD